MTNEELTEIYNRANNNIPVRHLPITTERIFAAMRAAIVAEREACAKACEDLDAYQEDDPGESFAAVIRMRSNGAAGVRPDRTNGLL